MSWPAIVLCLLLALLLCLMLGGFFLFRALFGRGALPVAKKQAQLPELQALHHRTKQARQAARAYLEAHGAEKVAIRGPDGTRLEGLLLRAAPETDSFVIGVHGYKSSKYADVALCAAFYHSRGKNLLLVDDRAHGESGGKYIGFGWLDRLDILAWCRYLTGRFGPGIRILLHGVSMGGAAVCCTAGETQLPPQVKGVISDCAFSAAWAELRYAAGQLTRLPTVPLLHLVNLYLRLFAHYDLRTVRAADQVARARVPFLFIHGEKDDFVPVSMAQVLYAACRTEKTLYIAAGAGHAMSWLADTSEYQAAVDGFMQKLGF